MSSLGLHWAVAGAGTESGGEPGRGGAPPVHPHHGRGSGAAPALSCGMPSAVQGSGLGALGGTPVGLVPPALGAEVQGQAGMEGGALAFGERGGFSAAPLISRV